MVPGILAFVAVVLGTAGNIYCQTVKFTQKSNDGTEPIVLYAGVFSYKPWDKTNDSGEDFASKMIFNGRSQEDCRYYGNYDTDGYAIATMAFAILTPVIGGLALFYAILGTCCTVPPSRWKAMGTIFMTMSVFQGLTLLVLKSSICNDNLALDMMDAVDSDLRDSFSNTCEWAIGLEFSIAAVAFWFLAGLSTFILPSPKVNRRRPQQSQIVTYQQYPDGTTEETNVVIVKGTNVPEAARLS